MDHLLWCNERRLNICYAIGAGVGTGAEPNECN